MSTFAGPEISNESLVFSFDSENFRKSWRGKPTTNLLPTSLLLAANATREIGDGKFKGIYSGRQATGVTNDDPRIFLYNSSLSVSASTFYTFSALYWSSNEILDDVYLKFNDSGWPESTYYIQPFSSQTASRNGSYLITELGGGWKYCTGTFQTQATTSALEQVFFDVDVANVVVFITNIQLEQSTFATPYIDGSRTTTNSLNDLTGNHTITINDLTYNSDNTFTFDGSNDYLSLPSISSQFTTNVTVEAVIKPTANSSDWVRIAGTGGNGGNRTFGLWYATDRRLLWQRYGAADPSIYPTSPLLVLNSWNHVVATCSGTSHTLYLNGEIIGTATAAGPWAASNENVTIGFAGFHTYVTGQVSLVRLYTTGLTTAEVQQNFRAIRGRLGI